MGNDLRQRTALFGATQEDRLRLRIQYATADEAEAKRDHRKTRSGTGTQSPQYNKLKAVD